jgi:hypothetical protein
MYIVVSSPPAIEETGVQVREIEYRQGVGGVIFLKKKIVQKQIIGFRKPQILMAKNWTNCPKL